MPAEQPIPYASAGNPHDGGDNRPSKHFHHSMFHGFDFDATMLRIGSMNALLHGVENPDIRYRGSLADGTSGEEELYPVILAHPPVRRMPRRREAGSLSSPGVGSFADRSALPAAVRRPSSTLPGGCTGRCPTVSPSRSTPRTPRRARARTCPATPTMSSRA